MFLEFPEEKIVIDTDKISCLKIREETAEYKLIAVAHGTEHILCRTGVHAEIDLLFIKLKNKLKSESI